MLKATISKQNQDKERLLAKAYVTRTKEWDAQNLMSSDLAKDFVLKDGYKATELIQVAYDSTGSAVEEREVKALIEVGKELAPLDNFISNWVKTLPQLTVVTWNEKREVEKDGMTVKFKPLWEWLLEEYKQVDIPLQISTK